MDPMWRNFTLHTVNFCRSRNFPRQLKNIVVSLGFISWPETFGNSSPCFNQKILITTLSISSSSSATSTSSQDFHHGTVAFLRPPPSNCGWWCPPIGHQAWRKMFRYKWRVRLTNRMNFRKNFKRPLTPPSSSENYTAISLFTTHLMSHAQSALHNRGKSGPIIPSPCIFKWEIEKLRITTFAVHVWSNRVIDLTRTETAFQVLNLLPLSNKDIQDWWNYPRLGFPKQ